LGGVIYSDAGGAFNINGQYVTIEALYDKPAPAGGGLNLAEIRPELQCNAYRIREQAEIQKGIDLPLGKR